MLLFFFGKMGTVALFCNRPQEHQDTASILHVKLEISSIHNPKKVLTACKASISIIN
jgi:hypothetical protein